MNSKRALKFTVASIAVIAALMVGLYSLILWECASARDSAPLLETAVAQWLLHYTVPENFRAMKNPLDVAASGIKCAH
jgi:hypothetical protein